MKKLLIAAATTAISASVAFADSNDNCWYGEANAGGIYMFEQKHPGLDATAVNLDQEIQLGVITLGAGKYVTDTVSVGLVFDYFNSPEAKKALDKDNNDEDVILNKYQAMDLKLAVSADLFDLGMAKAYIAAAVGGSATKQEFARTGKTTYNYKTTPDDYKYNFAGSVSAGVSAEVASNMHLKAGYTFHYLGELDAIGRVAKDAAAPARAITKASLGKETLKLHAVTAGVMLTF